MHIEVQVALNFVISYLYNKLPRRRVNLFGEELEKALDAKFQGHWYPDKPFKGSAFRCLKTGDPIDAVLDRAARESGVPIQDILENLPAELAVWIDPGEVSYRIGEKGQVKILHSESNDHHEDSSADREVTKTFNPEAQCFRPIDAVITNMTGLSLSPKTSPQDSPPTSAPSPTFKSTMPTSPAPAGAYLPRSQAPLTFTTATFAQTKFGSTKLKTSSKRANRMSPTEFSNYIKQRAMQQQLHHSHGHTNAGGGHLGAIGQSSPSRSLSPNPLAIGLQNDPFFFPNVNMGMYPPFGGPRNIVDPTHYYPDVGNMYNATSPGKYSSYLEPHNTNGNIYNGAMNGLQASAVNGGGGNGGGGVVPNAAPQQNQAASNGGGVNGGGGGGGTNVPTSSVQQTPQTPVSSPGSNGDNTKLLDSLNSFYNNSGPYQHLLVAN